MRGPAAALGVRLIVALMLSGTVTAWAQGTIREPPAAFTLSADHFFDASADLTGVSASLETDHLFAEGWWYRLAGDRAETFITAPDEELYEGGRREPQLGDVDGRASAPCVISGGGPTCTGISVQPSDGRLSEGGGQLSHRRLRLRERRPAQCDQPVSGQRQVRAGTGG